MFSKMSDDSCTKMTVKDEFTHILELVHDMSLTRINARVLHFYSNGYTTQQQGGVDHYGLYEENFWSFANATGIFIDCFPLRKTVPENGSRELGYVVVSEENAELLQHFMELNDPRYPA